MRRFGFDSIEQARQILADAVGGGGEAVDTQQTITADQADYLRATGMSDEEIAARYIVQ